MIGSCNCQDVQFELLGTIKKVLNCHCNLCRKMNGSAFSTYAVSLTNDFKLLSGKLTSVNVSDKATKHFCSKCCTPIFNQNTQFNGLNMLHIGSLDSDVSLPSEINIYSDSKLDWLDNLSELPSLEQGMA